MGLKEQLQHVARSYRRHVEMLHSVVRVKILNQQFRQTEIGSREAVWFAVAQGIGIGYVSDIEFISHENLRAIPIIDSDIYTTAHVACLTERSDSRLIGAFLDVTKGLSEKTSF